MVFGKLQLVCNITPLRGKDRIEYIYLLDHNPIRTVVLDFHSGPGWRKGEGKMARRAYFLTFIDKFMPGTTNSNKIHFEMLLFYSERQ